MESSYSTLNFLQHGKILFIPEIIDEFKKGDLKEDDSVRVLGKLKQYDVSQNIALIEHKNCFLNIDTTFLDNFPFEIGSMYQFIGELRKKQDTDTLCARARVARNIDGMDLALYEKSLAIKRKFEEKNLLQPTAKRIL